MKRAVVSGLLRAGLLLLLAPAALAARVQSVLLTSPAAGQAHLEIELNAPPRHEVFTLERPDRLVIDLAATQLPAGVKLPSPTGPVKSLRHGVQSNGKLRLVLELAQRQPAALRAQARGHRLIVDFGAAQLAGASTGITAEPAAARAAPAPVMAEPVAVRAPHAPGDAGRDIIVAVDAGHGGQDPGASGAGGTREKDVVLEIARKLAKRIDAEPGMKAFLTRDTDRFIPHRERMALARRARADIFISVHADAIKNREVTGSSVYVLSDRGATSEAARWLAEQENAADLKGGVSLGDKDNGLASVLMNLSQTASIGASMEAAVSVLGQLDRVGTVRKTQVQQAGFLVLKSPDIPSMLVETAFISNPGEERKLRSAAHQAELAEAIFNGVRAYFLQSPPDGTLFARQRESRRGATPMARNTAE